MSDTLSSIRRALRSARASERRALKHKMNPYNSLSKKPKTQDSDYDVNSAKTTQDVIEETLELASKKKAAGRFSVTQGDHLLKQCNIVSPEIREAWQAKIGMHSLLSDDVKEKLQLQAGNYQKLREMRLNELAKWMVIQWCDVEGYDPDKHLKK